MLCCSSFAASSSKPIAGAARYCRTSALVQRSTYRAEMCTCALGSHAPSNTTSIAVSASRDWRSRHFWSRSSAIFDSPFSPPFSPASFSSSRAFFWRSFLSGSAAAFAATPGSAPPAPASRSSSGSESGVSPLLWSAWRRKKHASSFESAFATPSLASSTNSSCSGLRMITNTSGSLLTAGRPVDDAPPPSEADDDPRLNAASPSACVASTGALGLPGRSCADRMCFSSSLSVGRCSRVSCSKKPSDASTARDVPTLATTSAWGAISSTSADEPSEAAGAAAATSGLSSSERGADEGEEVLFSARLELLGDDGGKKVLFSHTSSSRALNACVSALRTSASSATVMSCLILSFTSCLATCSWRCRRAYSATSLPP